MLQQLPAVALALLALLVAVAPLPFGSVVPAARAGLELGACLALLAALGGRRARAGLRRTLPVVGPMLLVAAWGWISTIRLPVLLVRLVSPGHARLYQQADDLTHPGAHLAWGSLSLTPVVSRRVGLWLGCLALALLAAAIAAGRRRSRRLVLAGLFAGALAEGAYGFWAWSRGERQIWGLDVLVVPGRLRGTYINPNHLAVYLEIALAMAFAFGVWSVRRAWRGKLLAWASAAGLLVLWAGVFAGLLLTGSRVGLVAACFGLLAQGILLAAERRSWRLAPLAIVPAVVGAGLIAILGLQTAVGRWMQPSVEANWHERLHAYGRALALWAHYPLFGTGLGSFQDAFAMVETPQLAQSSWLHLHSDVLEVPATLGLLGVGIAGYAIWKVLVRLHRVLNAAAHSEDRAAALGGFGIVAALAVHETFDFGLTIPANALALAIVLGSVLGARTDGGGHGGVRRRRTKHAAAGGGDPAAAGAPGDRPSQGPLPAPSD